MAQDQIPTAASETQIPTSTVSPMMKSRQTQTTATTNPYAPVPWTPDPKTFEGIEKPLKSGRPDGYKPSSLPISSSEHSSMTPLQFMLTEQDRHEKESKIVNKYKSIDAMQHDDKIKALKDPNLNPYNLANPYDGLANSLHRWKTVAADATAKNHTPEQKEKIASNYYDKMIAPLYGGMKIAPMSKKLWMEQAYTQATKYEIENSYGNSIISDIKSASQKGYAETDRAFNYVTDMLGNVLDDSVALWKKAHTIDPNQTPEQARVAQNKPWHETATELHNFISTVPHEGVLHKIANNFQGQADKEEFWSQVVPEHDGWVNHATSFVAEQTAQEYDS